MTGEKHYIAGALAPNLTMVREKEIASGGHVVDTLTASLWCLLTSKDYAETVLKAGSLGEDTDTTGIAAGGLAGVCYSLTLVPEKWRNAMARSEDLNNLFEKFVDACPVG